jgi:hypothetical protein
MRDRLFRPTAAAIVLGAVMAFDASAVHDADLGDDEVKCQIGTSLAIGKFIKKKASCIASCQHGAFAGSNPASNCVPPFAGSTGGCVQTAESDAQGLGQTKCAQDCPECFSGGDCMTDVDGRVADAESEVDALAAAIYCDDSASVDGLTAAEEKCRLITMKALGKFAQRKLKCLSKCHKDEHAGRTPPGSCIPPVSDARAAECIATMEAKIAALIDKKCDPAVDPQADHPDCGQHPTTSGAEWVAGVEVTADAFDADLFCGSPSGAFLEASVLPRASSAPAPLLP